MKQGLVEDIYKMHYRELYLYAYALSKDSYVAEELVSDTFYKYILAGDVASSHIKFWLMRVCKNTWIDYTRKQKNKLKLSLQDRNQKKEGAILDKLLVNERNQTIYREVLCLPAKYQEVLIMYYYLDTSLLEISTILGVKQGTIRTILYRARKQLKERLGGSDDEL
jgi:RNA polymerase sigma-70 factor (ECF subfamily)